MNKDKIKFAIVGIGFIGKRHAEMISKNRESELVALCDIKPKGELGINYPEVAFFSSIEEMLTSKLPIDVVNICTPNGLHAIQTIKALESGKHVVCEKPMALSKAEAEKMIYASMQASKQIFIVKQNRYSPPSQWLKEVMEKKILGDIYLVELKCFWNRDERYYKKDSWHGTKNLDGGTLFTQFSHFIDMMYWLFGDIKNIHSRLTNFNHNGMIEFEDTGVVTFEFVNGGFGSVNYSTSVWSENFESSITIIGSKGTIKVAGQYMNDVTYCKIQGYEMPKLEPTNPPNDYGAYKGSAANHHYIIENVVDYLKGRAAITTNAMEGLKVVDIIERIYAEGKR